MTLFVPLQHVLRKVGGLLGHFLVDVEADEAADIEAAWSANGKLVVCEHVFVRLLGRCVRGAWNKQ